MRTTIILDESFEDKIREQIKGKRLSAFVNQCIREHFEREERKKRMQELELAYHRASQEGKSEEGFETLETEDWPEW